MTSEPGSAAMEHEDRRTPCADYPWPWSYDDYADLVLSSSGHCINQSDDVVFKFLIAKVITLTRERDEAREALVKVRDGYGPNHLSRYAYVIADDALAGGKPE